MKMTFAGAVQSGFKNFANFKGKATRTEFWYFYLFSVLLNIVLSTFDALFAGGSNAMANSFTTPGPLYLIANVLLIVPQLSITVRRFHDAGFSGKWLLLWILPVAAFVATALLTYAATSKLTADSTDAEVANVLAAFVPALLLSLAVSLFQLVVQLLPSKKPPTGTSD